ncbi:MFS transporter [Burkholderia sp. WAC0059]|uniref:MFS transporter n=1 Tax=Burkholderia sp. WAC0059 TaxID=2066022 RepID=UPI0015E0B447|nr:MFS transporter [Burkholderia sp. WAC0059]
MTTSQRTLEQVTMRRVMWRTVPLLILCYIASYLDRVNISYAALTMNHQLGFSSSVYGLGAGVFFLTYFLFEVPSNMMLHRLGASRWIARILLTWGVLSGAMGFIPQIAHLTGLGPQTVFYVIRLLLGAAEAGFFPGVIFYLTLWFPEAYRARVVGYFMAAMPVAGVVGGPLCGWILGLNGVPGMAGWQWLFVLEAVPAIVLGFVVLFRLADRPERAAWLAPDQLAWLVAELGREQRQVQHRARHSVWQAMTNPMVIALSLIYFSMTYLNYTLGFFLPTIIHDFGLSDQKTGLMATIPSAVGAVCMAFWGWHSDRKDERKWHLAFALAVGSVCYLAASLMHTPLAIIVCFCIAAFGIYGAMPVFWTLPSTFLSGASAAAGIAVINAIANLSGFTGPYLMGWLKSVTGGYTAGMLAAAILGGIATLTVAGFGRHRFPVGQPAMQDGLGK